MTHQYRAEDFADLPKKALEALGVCISPLPSMTGMVTVALSPRLEYEMEADHAAALLVGMVQQRCRFFALTAEPECDDPLSWKADVLPFGSHEDRCGWIGHGPTPLSAVLSAYAAALEGK